MSAPPPQRGLLWQFDFYLQPRILSVLADKPVLYIFYYTFFFSKNSQLQSLKQKVYPDVGTLNWCPHFFGIYLIERMHGNGAAIKSDVNSYYTVILKVHVNIWGKEKRSSAGFWCCECIKSKRQKVKASKKQQTFDFPGREHTETPWRLLLVDSNPY